jgi:hypothetical protein
MGLQNNTDRERSLPGRGSHRGRGVSERSGPFNQKERFVGRADLLDDVLLRPLSLRPLEAMVEVMQLIGFATAALILSGAVLGVALNAVDIPPPVVQAAAIAAIPAAPQSEHEILMQKWWEERSR